MMLPPLLNEKTDHLQRESMIHMDRQRPGDRLEIHANSAAANLAM